MEALLASTMDTWPDDTEDEVLAANIRKGEQAALVRLLCNIAFLAQPGVQKTSAASVLLRAGQSGREHPGSCRAN